MIPALRGENLKHFAFVIDGAPPAANHWKYTVSLKYSLRDITGNLKPERGNFYMKQGILKMKQGASNLVERDGKFGDLVFVHCHTDPRLFRHQRKLPLHR